LTTGFLPRYSAFYRAYKLSDEQARAAIAEQIELADYEKRPARFHRTYAMSSTYEGKLNRFLAENKLTFSRKTVVSNFPVAAVSYYDFEPEKPVIRDLLLNNRGVVLVPADVAFNSEPLAAAAVLAEYEPLVIKNLVLVTDE
jgi:hypothetical protein